MSKSLFEYRGIIRYVPYLVAYIIPCLITIICIPIQIHFLRHHLTGSALSQISQDANHVTVTIIMVSSLFVLCNTPLALLVMVLSLGGDDPQAPECSSSNDYCHGFDLIHMLGTSTLPLLNAAGFTLILVLRKTALKERFKGYILKSVGFFLRAGVLLLAWGRGYEQIESEYPYWE